jgi:hypothetical protein
VRLYSNLHQDLFNKERKKKRGDGNERRRTNLEKIVRSQQEFSGEKNQKKGKNRVPQCLAPLPFFCPTWVAPLKGEGAKTVMHLTNACCPLLIKGDAH